MIPLFFLARELRAIPLETIAAGPIAGWSLFTKNPLVVPPQLLDRERLGSTKSRHMLEGRRRGPIMAVRLENNMVFVL